MLLFIPGQKVPKFEFFPLSGGVKSTEEFDQKNHLVLLNPKPEDLPKLPVWQKESEQKQKTWNWLGLKVFVLKEPLPKVQAGLLIVDRWGQFFTVLEIGPGMWETLEKEMMYYEARHC